MAEAPPVDADEPEPALPETEAEPEPEASGGESAFAGEFGFLEELAQDGPSSEPPGEASKGLVEGDEPHAADALTPPPWARVEPSAEPAAAPSEEDAPADWIPQAETPAAEEPVEEEMAPSSPEPGALPVWEAFEEPPSEAERIAEPTPAPEEDAAPPDEADSFSFEDDDIPGEPVELGGMDDPLGLASAFELLSVDSAEPDEPGEEAKPDETAEAGQAEPEDDWLAGLRGTQPEQDVTSLEPDQASA